MTSGLASSSLMLGMLVRYPGNHVAYASDRLPEADARP
jgi:hypothetical protein